MPLKWGLLGTVAAVVCLAGCSHITPDTAYADAFTVCENPGLDTRSGKFSDQSRGWGGNVAVGLQKGGGSLGAYRKRNDVTREYENAPRENDVYPVIDALHQDVVASCKAHMRCLSENKYIEQACTITMAKWRRAEWELASLMD